MFVINVGDDRDPHARSPRPSLAIVTTIEARRANGVVVSPYRLAGPPSGIPGEDP
jgi:hypothetical protein